MCLPYLHRSFLTNQVFSFQNYINLAASLSDFCKLVLIVLKISFSKNKPNQIRYQDYKTVNLNIFHDGLHHAHLNLIIHTRDKFNKGFLEILNKHAPLMRKLLWANYSFYVSKDMLKAIMKIFSGKQNYFFQNVASNLNIQESSFIQSKDYHHMPYPVQRAIAKYKHHPSV